MPFPAIPVLEFPIGSESIDTKIMQIKWHPPNVTVGQFESVSAYEISYKNTDIISLSKQGWETLSVLPSSSDFYNWIIPEYLFGAKIIIGVRAISRGGYLSEFAHSGVFYLKPHPLPKPSISNPVTGLSYGSKISIEINSSVLSDDSYRINRYRINLYYSSVLNNIFYAPIVERISGSTSRVVWDTTNLIPSEDYMLYCFVSDDSGMKGPQVSVGPFTIENQGYMIIDTEGPEVAVRISSTNGFVRDRDIGVELYAYDKLGGIHGFRLNESIRDPITGIPSEEVSTSEPRFYQKNNYLKIGDIDGRYIISALVEDLAGNRSIEEDASSIRVGNKYRKFFNKDNYKITSWSKSPIGIYVSFYDGTYTQVIKVFQGSTSVVSSFLGKVVSMALVNGVLYGGKFNKDRLLELISIESDGIVPVVKILSPDTEISGLSDSKDGGLIIGCINGDIYKYSNGIPEFKENIGSGIYSMYSGPLNYVFILTNSSDKVFVYINGVIKKVMVTI